MTRIAFITPFCAHYRRPLFELLARRLDVDFYFQSAGEERYWNHRLAPVEGSFRTVPLRRVRLAGHPLLPGLARTLSRRRYDAVVKSLDGRLMTPYVYGLARARGLPLVLWTGMWHHPRTVAHRLTRPLTEAMYRGADAMVVYGEHVARALAGVPGLDPAKVFVAGQAVDGRRFGGVERRESDPPEILYVGQLEERKGLADLVAAVALVDAPLRLSVAGSGSLEPALRDHAAADPRIRLAGHVPQEELPALYARARALVLPSRTTAAHRETWGLVVNEAMHAGVPAVATTAVGAAAGGLVVDGRNGFVCPERDPEALARALRLLVARPELAAAMGEQARADVSRFTYERMADAFERAVEHALRRRK